MNRSASRSTTKLITRLGATALFGLLSCARFALAQELTHVSTAPPQPQEEAPAAMCTTELRLSGAFFNGTHPERSFAVFETPASHSGSVYRIGTWIAGFELIEVAPRGVLLRRHGGEECWLQLEGEPSRARAVASRTPRKLARSQRAKRPNKSQAVVIGQASSR